MGLKEFFEKLIYEAGEIPYDKERYEDTIPVFNDERPRQEKSQQQTPKQATSRTVNQKQEIQERDNVDIELRNRAFIDAVKKKEKKDIIIFAVENSSKTDSYKDEIKKLIQKIVESNKENFFVMLKIGNGKKFYEPLDYECFNVSDILNDLFSPSEPVFADYLEVLDYIEYLYTQFTFKFENKDKKYEIQNISIVFFGSGKNTLQGESLRQAKNVIRRLKIRTKIKTFKYFCMEDRGTLEVAKLGFPVIGHISTNFYN